MSKIKNVLQTEGCKLEVQLENGSSIMLKLENKYQKALFEMLADKLSLERQGEDGSYLCWGDEVEISLDDLVRLSKDQEEQR